jgi:hypothetical protein
LKEEDYCRVYFLNKKLEVWCKYG